MQMFFIWNSRKFYYIMQYKARRVLSPSAVPFLKTFIFTFLPKCLENPIFILNFANRNNERYEDLLVLRNGRKLL